MTTEKTITTKQEEKERYDELAVKLKSHRSEYITLKKAESDLTEEEIQQLNYFDKELQTIKDEIVVLHNKLFKREKD